ncbi:MAG: hypothetical protein ACE5I1_04215 [bacterium]
MSNHEEKTMNKKSGNRVANRSDGKAKGSSSKKDCGPNENGRRIPDNARITVPRSSAVRLLGSHPSGVSLLRQRKPGDFPVPLPPTLPPPPPPAVSVPDVAFQLAECLTDEQRGNLLTSLRAALATDADVRTECIESSERIGIWLRPAQGSDSSLARNRGLQRLEILDTNELYACFVNSSLIRRNAQERWNATPKRLNGSGRPDANGPIHLTAFSISFDEPDRVITRIDGYDERPWPDVDFQLITTDSIWTIGGAIQCESEADLDTDESWLNVLTGLFLLLGAFVSPVFLIAGGFFLVERIIVGSAETPDANAGAGCGAAQLIPSEIMLPGTQKINFIYTRINVSSGGIYAGGLPLIVDRQPSVTIKGPLQGKTNVFEDSVRLRYRIQTDDLRGNLQVEWTADGTVLNTSAEITSIDFNTSGASVGDVLTRRVAVRVTDEDGLVAQADMTVQIHVTDLLDDAIPPICRVKPWLPQCLNVGAES